MPKNSAQKHSEREIQIQKALFALKNQEVSSIRAAARQFKISHNILGRRYYTGNTQAISHEMQQNLTNTEKSTFIRQIK